MTLVPVGQSGGAGGPLAVDGDRAYAVFGDRLNLIDVADPARPTLLGQSGELGQAGSLAAAGGVAYVATPLALALVDTRTADWPPLSRLAIPPALAVLRLPASPTEGLPPRLVLRGGPGLDRVVRVFDITVPAQPQPMGRYDAASPILGMAAAGATGRGLVLVEAGRGLTHIDTAGPGTPQSTVLLEDPAATDVAVAGQRAFVATVRTGRVGVLVVDLGSGTGEPAAHGLGFVPFGATAGIMPKMLGAAGDLGFMADVGASVIGRPVRVANAASSTGRPGELGSPAAVRWADSLAVEGRRLYVLDGQVGLRIMALDDLRASGQLGLFRTAGLPSAVGIDGERVDVAGGLKSHKEGVGGLRVVNVADSTRPTVIGGLDSIYPILDLAVDRGSAHLLQQPLNGSEHWVTHVAVPDSGMPSVFGFTTFVDAYGIDVSANLQAGFRDDLSLWDLQREASQQRLGDLKEPPPAARQALIRDGLVYSVGEAPQAWLEGQYGKRGYVLSIYQPQGSAPILLLGRSERMATENIAGPVALAIDGAYAYVAARTSGFHMFDISDVAHPRHVGQSDEPDGASALAFADGFIYTAGWGTGIGIVDVRDPRHPRIAGRFPSCPAQDVAVMRGHVYCAGGVAGLLVLRVESAPPPSP